MLVRHYTPLLDVPVDDSDGEATAATPGLPEAVATVAGTGPAAGVSLQVFDLRRTGRLAILRLGLRNDGREPFNPVDKFQPPELWSARVHDLSGARLRDPAARKEYLPLRDATGHCLCSGHIDFDGPLEPGVTDVLWVGFPGAPSDVRSMNVIVPHFPPVNVPVTGAGR